MSTCVRTSFPGKIFPAFLFILVNLSHLQAQSVNPGFLDPPREFSVMPFWFWNDTLKDNEIKRQIADFEAHGVYGFVIHPRIGLPDNIKWLSPEMIHFMRIAIDEAAKRNMYVVLYDEGMYPSGSSGGQVVARNPAHAARGLAKIDLKPGEEPVIPEGARLVTVATRPGGSRVAVIEQTSNGNIRGLHYIGEGTSGQREESPPAGDILNPGAVTSFIDLVYERYAKAFGNYFGSTVIGIFTDEPSPLGRGARRGMFPGNASLLPQINSILGYDIKPFLPDLWYNDSAESAKHRSDYNRAINICLEENYYKRLGEWCGKQGISLMGHPAGSMDIGTEKYFQVPGQDLVWRYVEPGPKALEGQHSTMAKCASSAMLHNGARRNSNELYGAYGHNLTFEEIQWLANWCFVRGQSLLFPHAFYYSIRGPRFDERPPDVGPNSTWWSGYKPYADACRRLGWINTDSRQVCKIAILAEATWLPDKPAKTCFQHQFDFNYLEVRHLSENAVTSSKGVQIAGMNYEVVILDSASYLPPKAEKALNRLARSQRLLVNTSSPYAGTIKGAVTYSDGPGLLTAIRKITTPGITLSTPAEDLRYRHVVKGGDHFFILFNEGEKDFEIKVGFDVEGEMKILDPETASAISLRRDEAVHFSPHELKIIRINNYFKLPPIGSK